MLLFSLSDDALLIILFRLPCSRLTIAGAAVGGEEGEERRKAEGDSGEGGELVADLPEVERLRIEVSRRSFSWRCIILSKISLRCCSCRFFLAVLLCPLLSSLSL